MISEVLKNRSEEIKKMERKLWKTGEDRELKKISLIELNLE